MRLGNSTHTTDACDAAALTTSCYPKSSLSAGAMNALRVKFQNEVLAAVSSQTATVAAVLTTPMNNTFAVVLKDTSANVSAVIAQLNMSSFYEPRYCDMVPSLDAQVTNSTSVEHSIVLYGIPRGGDSFRTFDAWTQAIAAAISNQIGTACVASILSYSAPPSASGASATLRFSVLVSKAHQSTISSSLVDAALWSSIYDIFTASVSPAVFDNVSDFKIEYSTDAFVPSP
jgi:hypothetical protein